MELVGRVEEIEEDVPGKFGPRTVGASPSPRAASRWQRQPPGRPGQQRSWDLHLARRAPLERIAEHAAHEQHHQQPDADHDEEGPRRDREERDPLSDERQLEPGGKGPLGDPRLPRRVADRRPVLGSLAASSSLKASLPSASRKRPIWENVLPPVPSRAWTRMYSAKQRASSPVVIGSSATSQVGMSSIVDTRLSDPCLDLLGAHIGRADDLLAADRLLNLVAPVNALPDPKGAGDDQQDTRQQPSRPEQLLQIAHRCHPSVGTNRIPVAMRARALEGVIGRCAERPCGLAATR